MMPWAVDQPSEKRCALVNPPLVDALSDRNSTHDHMGGSGGMTTTGAARTRAVVTASTSA